MIKLSSIFAIPTVVLAATAGVAAEPTKSFMHEGVTYVYESTVSPNGSMVLTGQALPARTKFRLVVRNGRVTGTSDRQPVSFPLAISRGAADGAVIVSRPARLASAD